MKINNHCVLSLSGGMDSTSLLLRLLSKKKKVYALTFDYGQKHKLEIEQSKKNIQYLNNNGFKITHKIINLSDCMSILSSSLTDISIDIPEGYYESDNMKSTVVPNRNAIFSSILYGYALTIAKNKKCNVSIVLGVHSGDHEIYPDCREIFYKKIMDAFNIGNWDSDAINIYLPYLKFNKENILKDASKSINKLKLDFKTIFKNTLTSYNPDSNGKSNGRTGADIERILAFDKLGKIDPLEYQESWENVLKYAKTTQKDFNKNNY